MPTMGTASVATGVVSMVLLTAVVVLGISVDRHGRLPGLPAFAGLRTHRYCSLFALALIAVHVITAVAVSSARIGLAAAVIPSVSLWIGLGAVSFDLLIALVVTSLLRRHLGHRWWRAVHWLAYACWPAAMVHSIAAGPGLHAGRLFDLAVACVIVVLAAGSWRLTGALRDLMSARTVDQRGEVAGGREQGHDELWQAERIARERWQSGQEDAEERGSARGEAGISHYP